MGNKTSRELEEAFYQSLNEGVVSYFSCTDLCGPVDYTARLCPKCGSGLELKAASGRGHVHSAVTYHTQYNENMKTPYTVLMVELEEGPRLIASAISENNSVPEVGSEVMATMKADSVLAFKTVR
ncbi:MAG: OB-fold domain-containing protein [Kordiimonadaceae bacterium]|nr:OB-fold domain-containing protein [Kordiimonadaceae bacterium]